MKPTRFVIVGSGNIASTYCNAINAIANAEIVGMVSRSGNLPKNAPEQVEVAPTLNELTVDFEAIVIATPNGLHHISAIEAAKLGKHVLTEKPLDITTEAMTRMIDACRTNNVRLGVAYQQRMCPDNIAVKKLLATGALGKIFAADLSIRCWRDQSYYDSASYRGNKAIDGGGPFIQQGAHGIDIYGWFFGRPGTTVSMLDNFCHDIEGEDYGVALLKHDNGMIGSITASTASKPGFPQVLTVHCEKGSFVMENNAIKMWEIDGVNNPAVIVESVDSTLSSATVSDTSGHQAIINDFITAIAENRDPVVNGESAAIATEITLDIYQNNNY
ncbi:MAG: Gfo/Idh/MocA family oxidoreductase [Victivallaceae bacterium]|nr:Gfo/Idh/MocA family oxidoreductase [Victivallaceae bacterium]